MNSVNGVMDKLGTTSDTAVGRDDLVWLADTLDGVVAENMELRAKLAKFEQIFLNVKESHEDLFTIAAQYTRRVKDLHSDLLAIEQNRIVLNDELDQMRRFVEELRSSPGGSLNMARIHQIRDALLTSRSLSNRRAPSVQEQAAAPSFEAAAPAPAPKNILRPEAKQEAPASGSASFSFLGAANRKSAAKPAPAPALDGDIGHNVDKWQKMFDATPRQTSRRERVPKDMFSFSSLRHSGLHWAGLLLLLLTVIAVGAFLGIKLSLTWLNHF